MSEKSSDETSSKSNNQINRRRFVQALGVAGGASTLGSMASDRTSAEKTTSISSAEKQSARDAMQPYNSVTAANAAINEFGTNMIAELSKQDILETPDVSQFEANSLLDVKERINATDGVYVESHKFNNEYSARIVALEETPSHSVGIYIHPQADKYYSIVETLDDTVEVMENSNSEVMVLDDSNGDVTTDANCYIADNNICKVTVPSYCGGLSQHKRHICPNYPKSCFPGTQIVGCCYNSDLC